MIDLTNIIIAGAQGSSKFSSYYSIGFMVLVFVIFYFLLIRPQQKKEKNRQRQIAAITKGDKIVTSGGLVCIVSDIKDDIIVGKIGNDVKIEIMKNFCKISGFQLFCINIYFFV